MLSESLIKTLLKSIDIEKLQSQALSDPRVREALNLVTDIRDKFATIEKQNVEIIHMLSMLGAPRLDAPTEKEPE